MSYAILLAIMLGGLTNITGQENEQNQKKLNEKITQEQEVDKPLTESEKEEAPPGDEIGKEEATPKKEKQEDEKVKEEKETAPPTEEAEKSEATPEKEKEEAAAAKEEQEDEKVKEEKKAAPPTEEAEKSEATPEKEKEEAAAAKEEQEDEKVKEEKKAAPPTEEAEKSEATPEKEVSEEQQQVMKEIKELEKVGIDTIDLEEPQGNWLFKRMWWEHAEESYEKIRNLEQKIWESRMHFFIKRTELDKTVLDPFYISIGIGQGELYEMLSELVNRLEKEREEEGVLDESERSLLSQLRTEQETLEQTKFDVESITQLDQEVDEALNRLMEQINRVRAYEREAWGYFKNIARVLSDTKARDLFFKMDTILHNLRNIDSYIQQDFSRHFSQLLQGVNMKINNVKNGIQKLQEKGIDFKKQLKNITQLDDLARVEKEQKVPEQDAEMQEEEEEETPGWATRAWNSFVGILWWPYEKLVGTKKANE